jgi:signal transduction histidine kinase
MIAPLLGADVWNLEVLWSVRRSFVALVLLVVLVLLVHQSRACALPVRRRRRLLITGTAASLLPLLMLSFVPELLWGTPLIDYSWTFPFLILMPFAYGYVIGQGELGQIDLLLNRSLVYVFLTALLLGLYMLFFYALNKVMPLLHWSWPVISAGLAIGVVMLYTPLRTRLQQWVDHLFYGGWYDYRTVVLSVSAVLGQAKDVDQLVERLLAGVQTMRFQAAALLWSDGTMLVPKGSFGYTPEVLQLLHVSVEGALAGNLCNTPRLLGGEQIYHLLRASDLTEAERALMMAQHVRLWVPLVSWGVLHGVLVIGERQSEVLLDKEDRDILATLAGQATVTAANVALLESLRMRLTEMERIRDNLAETQKRLAEGREEERLHLAQELHDGPVQELYGILFELDALSKRSRGGETWKQLLALQNMTEHVIHALRTICGELRPPALAPFGLEVAIRSHVDRYREAQPDLDVQVDLMHDGLTLPERVRLALFRIYQEAMNNIAQHAEARSVLVRLVLNVEQIVLAVRDDGRGFTVPDQWITLARCGHLGLLGIAERAEAIGGCIEVISAPGKGTTVRAIVPRASTLLMTHAGAELEGERMAAIRAATHPMPSSAGGSAREVTDRAVSGRNAHETDTYRADRRPSGGAGGNS